MSTCLSHHFPVSEISRATAWCSLRLMALAACVNFGVSEDSDWSATGDAGESTVPGMTSAEIDNLSEDQQGDDAADDEKPQSFIRNRRRFVMREFKFNADWDTDPTSLPAMVEQFKRLTGMDAQAMQPRQPLTFDSKELGDWPFVFMTAHNAFMLTDPETANLNKWLTNGGFLHADDCLYGFPFGSAFHGEIRKVFPGTELRPLPTGETPMANLVKQKFTWSITNDVGLPNPLGTNPFEYVDVGGRIAVLYTPPDIGCMWEISTPPTPSNPLGTGMHNMEIVVRDAAYKMGVNIIFYALTH